MKNNHKPEIRFPGVTGDWKLCKLKDISKIHDGTHQTPKYKDCGVKFVSVEDINDIEASNKYISTEDYETHFKNKPEVGDIFMTRITAGIIGATAVIESDDPIAYYVSLALIKPSNKISSLFLSSYISTKEFKKELNKRIIHTAFPKKINLADIGECSVSRPSKEEQVKIGIFSKMLEDTIALHQQELTTLKQTKRGFLQKMFPKEGESVPKVRFPGFTGDWEECKLGEILKINSGRDYKHLQQGNIPVYGTGGYMLSVNNKLSDEDAIGIGRKGTIDNPQLLKAPFWTVDTLFYMTTKEKNDLLFCYSLANKIHWKKYDESTGVPSLSKSSIDKISISIPTPAEQSKIGNFFKQLDDTIALHQRELDALKETKKAFLQKMFV
ncbi:MULTISPECIES: restriction endonuclease subunit S [Bacillus cereus group]|uniref:Restriction endonuclease subunit S n=1 Tax=Bacillus thuringiensis TaxID=1428 RepID=A0A9X6TPP3_BACTU|nr:MULTISPECIES: restriction endonuclease subunit S [Bacillus cereus group]PEA90150.1 restriction endonuclease subunit S [Bacillus thuringiensis]PEW09163.1 restriction endonuclease subunit S [Bacillus cereus]